MAEIVRTAPDAGRRGRVATAVVIIVGGLLIGYDVFEAVQNWIGVAQYAQLIGDVYGQVVTLPASTIVILFVAVAAPVVAFGLALLVGRRRPWWQLALAMLAAWTVENALFITLTAAAGGAAGS